MITGQDLQSVATIPNNQCDVALSCTRSCCAGMELLDHSNATQQLQGGDPESTTLQSDDDRTRTSRERLVRPSNQSSDFQGDSVKDGLLGPGEEEEKEKWRCSPSSWDWKKLLLITCLWWAYFLINGAHSMIAPFFPNQVMETIVYK